MVHKLWTISYSCSYPDHLFLKTRTDLFSNDCVVVDIVVDVFESKQRLWVCYESEFMPQCMNPNLGKENLNNRNSRLDSFHCKDNRKNILHALCCNLQHNLYPIHSQQNNQFDRSSNIVHRFPTIHDHYNSYIILVNFEVRGRKCIFSVNIDSFSGKNVFQ